MPSRDVVAAILLGNLIYFLLMPRLPGWAQHRRFALDAGIAVDFIFCAVLYGIFRLVRSGRAGGGA